MRTRNTPVRGRSPARSGWRRGGRTSAPAPSADKIRKAVRELSTFPGRMGIEEFVDDEGELLVVTDPQAVAVADVFLGVMDDPDEEAVTGAVRPQLERLKALVEQHDQMGDNAHAAEKLDSDLRDTDRWAAGREKAMQDELFGLLGDLLDPQRGGLSRTERDRLDNDAGEILAMVQEEKAARSDERAMTMQEMAAHRAALRAADEEENLLRVRSDLARDRPVDPQALARAVETLREMRADRAAPPPPARRGRKR